MIKDRKAASKTKRKRIHWNRPPSPGVVSYRLYWAVLGEVSYDSESIDLGDRTEVILPDQVPSLQQVRGEVALGITALNRDGNESDMVRFSVHFDSPIKESQLGCYGWGKKDGSRLPGLQYLLMIYTFG